MSRRRRARPSHKAEPRAQAQPHAHAQPPLTGLLDQSGMEPEPPAQADSPTSVAAAKVAKRHAAGQSATIREALRALGAMTDEELTEATGIPPNSARPRRVQMMKDGLVRQVGVRRTRSGAQAAVWGLVADDQAAEADPDPPRERTPGLTNRGPDPSAGAAERTSHDSPRCDDGKDRPAETLGDLHRLRPEGMTRGEVNRMYAAARALHLCDEAAAVAKVEALLRELRRIG